MSNLDLNEVIEDSISDAELPLEEPEIDSHASEEALPESSPEPVTTDTTEPTSSEVQSPAAKQVESKQDDFEKRYGIPQNSATGRENRIPYSRVKRITEKAEKDAEARIRGEYTPKLTDFETKVQEYNTKISDYEGRLSKVAEFENIMVNDVPRFLGMLAQMPQYAQALAPLYQQPPQAPQEVKQVSADDPMPQPDAKLPDGTMTYSTEGFQKWTDWNRRQAAREARESTLTEVEKKFGPLYTEWEAHHRVQQLLPKVQAQITEARKWPQFNENEADIVKALQANPNINLERAYQMVVLPKLTQAQENAKVDQATLEQKIREKILAEMQSKPRSTSTAASRTAPTQRREGGSRDLTSVIEDAIKELK